jgi:hypothetical protein
MLARQVHLASDVLILRGFTAAGSRVATARWVLLIH